MTSERFPHLFSPLTIRGVTLKNRILSTGHETALVDRGRLGDARARLNDTVWADEVSAQRYEQRVVTLWDALRARVDWATVLGIAATSNAGQPPILNH